jgi:hypothetical protein
MIDPRTGIITFESPVFSIGPATRRSDFLSSTVGALSQSAVDNEPWHSWHLPPLKAGDDFDGTVYFTADEITMVILENADPRFGTSWTDYSNENERARKAAHDQWLAERCQIATGRHAWGAVTSTYGPSQPWAGLSSILVRYRE